MKAHELAKQLLELPDDTEIFLSEKGKNTAIKVKSFSVIDFEPSKTDPLYDTIKSMIDKGITAKFQVYLNYPIMD